MKGVEQRFAFDIAPEVVEEEKGGLCYKLGADAG